LLPIEQVVCTSLPRIDPQRARVEFDASPWGGGAVLFVSGVASEFFEATWDKQLAHHLSIKVGESSGQSCWEFLTLYLSLLLWGTQFSTEGVSIAGDNTAALANAVTFKGRSGLNRISMELSWRKVRFGWRYQVAHLPSEGNVISDALSRTSAPHSAERKSFPQAALRGANRREVPETSKLWVCS